MTAPSSQSGSTPSSSDIQMTKVESSHSARPLWLVKVPKYLANIWEKSTEELVGEVTITKKPNNQLNITLNVKVSPEKDSLLQETDSIPKSYDLPLSNETSQKMVVVAEHKNASGISLGIDGQINRRADIRPSGAGGSDYMNFKKAQIKQATAPKRTAMQVERVVNFKPFNTPVKRPLPEVKEAARPEKKMRDDKEVVTERVFAAFEKHQYINIRDLVNITNQPVAYLKEILTGICDYNVKNPHKNMWELKPQYRHYTA